MSRYIDAELLEPDTEWDDYEDGFISYSQLNIDTAETADVVDVVRCKDCKYGRDAVRWNYKHKLNLIDCNRIRYEHPYIMRSDDFCSFGERADT